MNAWIYIGGYIAYKGFSFEQICQKVSWLCGVIIFCAVNFGYYYMFHYEAVHTLLALISFILVFKSSLLVWDSKVLLSVSASSTFLYMTHIFVLNVSRHCLAKVLVIDSDWDMCIYYVLNATICVIVCLGTYFALKSMKANMLLKVLTGGRV